MPQTPWPFDPIMKVILPFEQRIAGRAEAGALMFWSTLSVDSLFYLQDLDDDYRSKGLSYSQFNPQVTDSSHLRWAAGTAITAVDQCSAAMARAFCGWTSSREASLRNFDPTNGNAAVNARLAVLPHQLYAWVASVHADQRYVEILSFRHPTTHARTIRHHHLSTGTTVTPTQFQNSNGKLLTAHEIVRDAREFAFDSVLEFFRVIDSNSL